MKRQFFRGMAVLGCLFWVSGCGQQNTNVILPESHVFTQESSSFEASVPSASSEEIETAFPDSSKAPDFDAPDLEIPSSLTPVPGENTLQNLLLTAIQPLGSTMYIWGGAWNEDDTGAGIEARTLGVSPRWAEFSALQDSSYDHSDYRYRIHDGLDCSGYIGWVIYNVMETENEKEGYVFKSTQTARILAQDYGFGDYYSTEDDKTYLCGDIVSMKGHVWLSLGTCADGSTLLLHASPPGVKLSGTPTSDGTSGEATELAKEYMQKYYPEWYQRYPDCDVPKTYKTNTGLCRFDTQLFPDASALREKSPKEILELLFPNTTD